MRFEDLPGTKKGNIGELEVDKYLESIGIIPYAPVIGRAHPFDRLCASGDKKKLFIAECKAKAARTYYPDTGINESNYLDYQNIYSTYGIDVWIFFVDEHRKSIYGNLLTILNETREIVVRGIRKQYPSIEIGRNGRKIRYFPLIAMIKVCDIEDSTAQELVSLSRRNWGYEAEAGNGG